MAEDDSTTTATKVDGEKVVEKDDKEVKKESQEEEKKENNDNGDKNDKDDKNDTRNGTTDKDKAKSTNSATTTTTKAKPKRGGSKPILKTSGIARHDNQLKQTLFTPPVPINQKNYYTDYLKRDDQILFYREFNDEMKRQKELKKQKEEEAKAKEGIEEEVDAEEIPEAVGSKVVVIHPGSQNLRIGLATQVYPKSVPNVIAHRIDDNFQASKPQESDEMDIEHDFESAHQTVQDDLNTRMKFYKRRILPNSHQTVSNYNNRVEFEEIPEHNDPYRVEWTEIDNKSPSPYYTGLKATRIPPDSKPQYQLKWPIRYGMFNERDYETPQQILGDISLILMDALKENLSIDFKEYKDYNTILLIPDLYDKSYVSSMINLLLEMGFANVAILQEGMGATFGAGISTACIVDVGAEKCSVACVEEGMVIPDSRINLRFGGDDITSAFIKMLQNSQFPYAEVDLSKQYDWALANELKKKFCTCNDADITVQLYNFYQRQPDRLTRKYQFKTFDEPMLAPLGLFYPQLFDLQHKITTRYSLFPRSIDIYEQGNVPNDPISDAQINIFQGTLASEGKSYNKKNKQEGQAAENKTGGENDNNDNNNQDESTVITQAQAYAEMNQKIVPSVGIEHAIIESVTQAALKSQGSKQNAFYENLMIVGGGAAKLSGFNNLLTDRLSMFLNNPDVVDKYTGDITVMPIPREMDPELITWKGGSVYSKLKIVNEVWISKREWEIFGSRCLQYKVLFMY